MPVVARNSLIGPLDHLSDGHGQARPAKGVVWRGELLRLFHQVRGDGRGLGEVLQGDVVVGVLEDDTADVKPSGRQGESEGRR